MSDLEMDYKAMVTTALRDVVRQALEVVADHGLAEKHPLYVSFLTGAPGVRIPETLRAAYPEEMTIVFQHQFWDLEIERWRFSVDMVFQGARHSLVVPFAAVTAYSDPSVPFGLRFGPLEPAVEAEREEAETESVVERELVDNVIRFDRTRGD